MHTKRRIASLLVVGTVICTGVIVVGFARDYWPGDVNLHRKVQFSEVAGVPVFLDIAWPKERAGRYPVVVFLHGGAWSREGAAFREEITDAARRGYVAIRVNYRLVESDSVGHVGHRFPAQLDDVRQALVWLSEHHIDYSADTERVALVGASAGGHLALLAGLPNVTLQADDASHDAVCIKAIVDMYAPVDLAEAWNARPIERPLLEAFLGGSLPDNPEAYHKASPIHFPNRHSPPVLILHGKLDERVPLQQSERLAHKLRDAGVEQELVVFNEEGHGFSNAGFEEASVLIYQFLGKHLVTDVQ